MSNQRAAGSAPLELTAPTHFNAQRRARVVLTATQLAIFVGFLAIWEGVVRLGWVDPFFISTPTAVYEFLNEFLRTGLAWESIWATVRATIYGFVLGSTAGMVGGLLFSGVPFIGAAFRPFMTALNALPRVALAPMFVLWFGVGIESKVYLSFSLVFFIVLLNTEAAIKNADREMLTMARLNGANTRKRFTKVAIPASIPPIFAALQLSAVYSLLGVVVGEMLAAERGLGQQLTLFSSTFRSAGVFGVLVILVIIALILNGIMTAIERRLTRWSGESATK